MVRRKGYTPLSTGQAGLDTELLITHLKELDENIYNPDIPIFQKQQYTNMATNLRKKYTIYKKSGTYLEFSRTIEDAIELGKRRVGRGLEPTDSSKDEEMNLQIHTIDTGCSSDEDLEKELEELEKSGVKLVPVINKNTMNNSLLEKYKNQTAKEEGDPTPVPDPKQKKAKTEKSTTAPSTPSATIEETTRGTKRQRETDVDAQNTLAQATTPSSATSKKKKKMVVTAQRPDLRYSDVGGVDHVLQDLRELIEYPFTHPELYKHLGVEPARGVLLFGPPGSGKTMLATAIAGELGIPFFKISAPEFVSGMSGESESKIRALFKDAVELAPSLIFIDEIDAIAPKRDNAAREMEKRIVAQLLTCMDDLTFTKTNDKMVLVIGATNRPDSIDDALRRAGRFDREISLGIPDEKARVQILKIATTGKRLSHDIDFLKLAKLTPGFVGADLKAVVQEATIMCINRNFSVIYQPPSDASSSSSSSSPAMVQTLPSPPTYGSGLGTRSADTSISMSVRELIGQGLKNREPIPQEVLDQMYFTNKDFEESIKKVQPSSKREGFATVPDVTWEDIGALDVVRSELQLAILEPIRNSEKYIRLGLTAPSGVLLYGPPGCGKTLLAKAIANDSGANFISVKGPELLNKFVGESERAVRQVFARAAASSPCVIFFDELDALAPKRSMDSTNSSTERVVNQLLTEMDGVEGRRNVYVIAATNRPDIIDPAMLRPGRLDKLLYVPLPNESERSSILVTSARKTPLDVDVDIEGDCKVVRVLFWC
ncbi:ribosome biogenesis ATPase [Acrasis kona]|uniref:Ribosome biogenesis ATPase n=1 Tax=Acrasis kona TaxID=1008807 RepID=A0AAW2Z2I4_9EUKA